MRSSGAPRGGRCARLQDAGLHPLWATALIFTSPRSRSPPCGRAALRQVLGTPALWLLVAAAGCTNAAFNWAIVIGDVVRVVLLFYLMPLWTVLLARVVLGERLTQAAALRVALGTARRSDRPLARQRRAVAGRGFSTLLPLPRSLADWLGIVGGFSFAFNNVMLRREAGRPEEGRALAMFLGGALVAGALAAVLTASGAVPASPAPAAPWLALAGALTRRVPRRQPLRCSTARRGCRRTGPPSSCSPRWCSLRSRRSRSAAAR